MMSVPQVMAAAATPQFNNLPDDYGTILVGKSDQTWKTATNTVSAQSGDIVSVFIWDHNTVVNSTAENVKIQAAVSTSEAASHTISATVSADNAASVSGTATINVGAISTIEYIPGSAHLYKNVNGNLTQADFPSGVDGNNVVTTGVNLGSQGGCWQYSQAIIFQVKVITKHVAPKPIMKIEKMVRKYGTSDDFQPSVRVNPGTAVEFRITVSNVNNDGAAENVTLKDILPGGLTFTTPSRIVYSDGSTGEITEAMLKNGAVIVQHLGANQSVNVYFASNTASTYINDQCVVNTAQESTETLPGEVKEATAQVCFAVAPTPTPTPTPTATPTATPTVYPTPTPTLPKSGPEMALLVPGGLSGLGLFLSRRFGRKQQLTKSLRKIDIA